MSFEKLIIVDTLAKQLEVSWSFNYEEGPNTYYGVITSPAPSECWVSKSHSLKFTLDCFIEELQRRMEKII